MPKQPASGSVKLLSELEPNTLENCFALLASKEEKQTRDGKPYFRVTFKDKHRTAATMVWSDAPFFAICKNEWQPGDFFKILCKFSESKYGPQIEIDRIFPLQDSDRELGFDPANFVESSGFDEAEMFQHLYEIAETNIVNVPLKELVLGLLNQHDEAVKSYPAASRNHHAFLGGFLEHVLSVTRNALFFAVKYSQMYPEMQPQLSVELVVAGAILHDIGKLQELESTPQGATYTPAGKLIGHILLGRDMVRDKAAEIENFDPEILLRLEHIVASHQDRPEWGSPVSPHTPEALLVHYADDVDAKFQMMATALSKPNASSPSPFTPRDNPLRREIFRGWNPNNGSNENGNSEKQ